MMRFSSPVDDGDDDDGDDDDDDDSDGDDEVFQPSCGNEFLKSQLKILAVSCSIAVL